ncbi:MAG: Ig-like domain-containing protein [Deltaproteobacteria bacterium]|nr:Ig-like domain-containing protein [Deltaproteobacteria bacterium]
MKPNPVWTSSRAILVAALFMILAACGGGGGGGGAGTGAGTDTGTTPPGPKLQTIAVTPDTTTVPRGTTQAFAATGTYSDGSTADITSTVTWASGSLANATIAATGLATVPNTAVLSGTSVISATLSGVTGSTTLTVGNPVLTTLAVSPATQTITQGLTANLTATGTYSDGTSTDVTAQATWATTDAPKATVAGGVVTAVSAGTGIIITASFGGITATASITVTAAVVVSFSITPASASIAKGLTQAFTATATYNTTLKGDITGQVVWSSTNTGAATIVSSTGVATGAGIGSSTISASYNGTLAGSNTAALTVTAPDLASILITPANPFVVLGTTQQFTATGIYTDGTQADLTNSVTWSITGLAATLSPTGLASVPAGSSPSFTSTITATSGTVSASTTLTADVQTLAYDKPTSVTLPFNTRVYYKVTLPTAGDYIIKASNDDVYTYAGLDYAVSFGTCTTNNNAANKSSGCVVTTTAIDTVVYLQQYNASAGSRTLTFWATPSSGVLTQGTAMNGTNPTGAEQFYTVQYDASPTDLTLTHTITNGLTLSSLGDAANDLSLASNGAPCTDRFILQGTVQTGSRCLNGFTGAKKYWVSVADNIGNGTTAFTLKALFANQGSTTAPTQVFPGAVTVSEVLSAAPGGSYYWVTYGNTNAHTVTLLPRVNDADLYVYSDAAFTALVGSSVTAGTVQESVTIPAGLASTTFYIKVSSPATGGTSFDLTP